MLKLISNQICPNLSFADGLVGLWNFIINKRLEINFSPYFRTENYLLLNNARGGLKLIAEHYQTDNKVFGIPAFICAVVAVPFLAEGYKVEWIDVDENGVIDYEDFQKKADKISVLIGCHTFGLTFNVDKFSKVCQEKNILFIEDCAHNCRPLWDAKKSPADIQLLSFGREKDFSCVSGGALIFGESKAGQELQSKITTLSPASASNQYTLQHLLNPLIYNLALPWWNAGGKIIPWLAHKLKLLPKAVTPNEKQGLFDTPITTLPSPLQVILKREFDRIKQTKLHRQKIATAWKKIIIQQFPQTKVVIPKNNFRVIIKNTESLKSAIKQQKSLHLREWDGNPIAPSGTNLEKLQYTPGSCPNAEKFSADYLTLPTNPKIKLTDVAKILKKG